MWGKNESWENREPAAGKRSRFSNPPLPPSWTCGRSSASVCRHLGGLSVRSFLSAFSTFNIHVPTSSLSLICHNPLLSGVISAVVIISSSNRTDASWKVRKSCFIDSTGMVIDPAKFAWEYVLFEPRDHNRSDGIRPVSALLAFQRLR